MHGLVESWCEFGCWCAANRLLQVGVCRRIVELHCLDPAEEVVVTRVLRVGSGGGEIRFGDQFVGLVVQTVMEVTAEKAVDQRGLRLIVVAKGSSSLCSKEQAKERSVNERGKAGRGQSTHGRASESSPPSS